MPQRKPRRTRPSKHILLYKDDRWIRVPKAIAHIAKKKGGWSETPPATAPDETIQYPVHKGAGIYELSDGGRIKGKEAAAAAQTEINQRGGDD